MQIPSSTCRQNRKQNRTTPLLNFRFFLSPSPTIVLVKRNRFRSSPSGVRPSPLSNRFYQNFSIPSPCLRHFATKRGYRSVKTFKKGGMGEMGGEGVEMTKKRRKKRRKKKKERKRRRRRRREIKENTRKQGSPSEMSSPFVKSWLCYSNFLSSFYSPLFINAPLYPYPLISYSISFCIRPPPSHRCFCPS